MSRKRHRLIGRPVAGRELRFEREQRRWAVFLNVPRCIRFDVAARAWASIGLRATLKALQQHLDAEVPG